MGIRILLIEGLEVKSVQEIENQTVICVPPLSSDSGVWVMPLYCVNKLVDKIESQFGATVTVKQACEAMGLVDAREDE